MGFLDRFTKAAPPARLEPIMHTGQPAVAHKAASAVSQELACWQPPLMSADRQQLPEKESAEGRARDMVRNNGIANGIVSSKANSIVGARYRLQIQPDYKTLGIDPKEASQWASRVEQQFETWAGSPDCWIDAQRRRTLTQFLREAVGTEYVQGEVFLLRQWRPSPSGFSTCFLSIAPERICNPYDQHGDIFLPNGNKIRAGVELNGWGEAVAYHVRSSHKRDYGHQQFGTTWTRIPKRSRAGYLNVIHVFDVKQPDQTRGFSGMAPTLQKLKMMDMQEDLELQLTALTTAMGFYLKTSLGQQRAREIMGMAPDSDEAKMRLAGACLEAHQDYYGDKPVSINGVRVPVLFPEDEMGVVQPHNQAFNHEQFKKTLMHQVAVSSDMSYEVTTGDYSSTSYSSARASGQVQWQGILGKRASVVDKIASQIFMLWLDEGFSYGQVEPPSGIDPESITPAQFAALSRATWIGAGKIVIDEYKQTRAYELQMKSGQTPVSDVLAENGNDLETKLDQDMRDREMYIERDLPLPEHLGGVPVGIIRPDLIDESGDSKP